MYVVGHNSGRTVETAGRVLAAGADVVEIDDRSLGGVLVSAYLAVPTVGDMAIFFGPTGEEVWAVSGGAEAVLLDRAAIDRLHSVGLLVFAWTVNDRARAEALVRLGVDGIITDRAALFGDLGSTGDSVGMLPALNVGETAGSAATCT